MTCTSMHQHEGSSVWANSNLAGSSRVNRVQADQPTNAFSRLLHSASPFSLSPFPDPIDQYSSDQGGVSSVECTAGYSVETRRRETAVSILPTASCM